MKKNKNSDFSASTYGGALLTGTTFAFLQAGPKAEGGVGIFDALTDADTFSATPVPELSYYADNSEIVDVMAQQAQALYNHDMGVLNTGMDQMGTLTEEGVSSAFNATMDGLSQAPVYDTFGALVGDQEFGAIAELCENFGGSLGTAMVGAGIAGALGVFVAARYGLKALGIMKNEKATTSQKMSAGLGLLAVGVAVMMPMLAPAILPVIGVATTGMATGATILGAKVMALAAGSMLIGGASKDIKKNERQNAVNQGFSASPSSP